LSTKSGAKYIFIFLKQNSEVKRVKYCSNAIEWGTEPNERSVGTEKVQKYGTDIGAEYRRAVLKNRCIKIRAKKLMELSHSIVTHVIRSPEGRFESTVTYTVL
jgi:hypothetical protein